MEEENFWETYPTSLGKLSSFYEQDEKDGSGEGHCQKLKITDSKGGSSIGWHPSNRIILLATGSQLRSASEDLIRSYCKPSVAVKPRKEAGKCLDSL